VNRRRRFPTAAWAIPLTLVGVVALYLGVLSLSARMFDWRALADRYPDQPMHVERSLGGRVTIGSTFLFSQNYTWSHIEIGDHGLRTTPSLFSRYAPVASTVRAFPASRFFDDR
jgi:hypothetical protein